MTFISRGDNRSKNHRTGHLANISSTSPVPLLYPQMYLFPLYLNSHQTIPKMSVDKYWYMLPPISYLHFQKGLLNTKATLRLWYYVIVKLQAPLFLWEREILGFHKLTNSLLRSKLFEICLYFILMSQKSMQGKQNIFENSYSHTIKLKAEKD